MSKSEEDTRLHRLCHDGTVEEVKSFAEQLGTVDAFADRLAGRKGVFGYTPLHEAVAGGNHEVLDYLLTMTSSAHIMSTVAVAAVTPCYILLPAADISRVYEFC